MLTSATSGIPVLSDQDGPAVEIINPTARSGLVIVCEHAADFIPESLGGLGLSTAARSSHVAWDPGARDVALALSGALDAVLVAARVSRLVYDCNRPPHAQGAMPEKSEVFDIPGNRALTEEQARARVREVYDVFSSKLAAVIQGKLAGNAPVAMVTIHSFTPVFFGKQRNVEIGVLFDADDRLARLVLEKGRRLSMCTLHENQPYGPQDGVTHTLVRHGLGNGIPNVMIEIRNDLIATREGVKSVAEFLARTLATALESLGDPQEADD